MIDKMLVGAVMSAGLLGIASAAADAQSAASDAAYCGALIDKYQTYFIGTTDPDTDNHVRVDLDVAVVQCQAGNTAAGIPPLEKALRGAKFSLPPRA